MILILSIALLCVFLYAWSYIKDKRINYFARKGIEQLDGTNLIYGDGIKIFKEGHSLLDVILEQYSEFKKKGVKFGGKYLMFCMPTLMILDLELIKHVMVKDFDHFMDHGLNNNSKLDPLSAHLFNLGGAQWKSMRHKLTPTFSSGKIKKMFQILHLCTSSLKEVLEVYAGKKEPVDIQETLARFTTDVIGNCAFGIETNSLKDPDSKFRYYGKQIFGPNGLSLFIKDFLIGALPTKISELLHLKMTDPEVEHFFMNMVKTNAEYREKNKVIRNDFFQLLLQLKNEGHIDDEENNSNNSNVNDTNDKMTLEEIAAQCYVFFIGGFDTSSNTMSFALYELADNQEIQEKLRQSINNVLKKYGGEMTYDSIQEMEYLDMVINESIRKYPLAAVLPRSCTKTYKIPGTEIIMVKGDKVQVPVVGLHRDPDYFPDPMKFDPDRFNKENVKSRISMTYLPFGEGPRQCIGTRFGLLQSKMGVATIIKDFKITINKEKSELPLTIKPGFVSSPKNIYLNVEKI